MRDEKRVIQSTDPDLPTASVSSRVAGATSAAAAASANPPAAS